MTPIRAIGMLSGGLDSALAARLMLDQGIEVVGLHLEAPTACRSDVREVARELGIRLEVRPKGEEFLRLVRNPQYGYGKNMNPCVDCRTFMFKLSRVYLEQYDARFIFTGEVVGQRPMSQTRDRILMIDRVSDMRGWILRPLSARLLPETEPERLGWVDRSRLLGISGRSRDTQLELASRYGLSHYNSPGGGCLLTDAIFSNKLRDLFANSDEDHTSLEDVALLRLGRHFRVHGRLKVVLGRNHEENVKLAGFAMDGRWLIEPVGFHGPHALVCGPRDDEALSHAVALIVRHTTREVTPEQAVRWRENGTFRQVRLGDVPQPREHLIQIGSG